MLGLVFLDTKPRDWLVEKSPKWPILCPLGRKTTTQSINQLRVWRAQTLCYAAKKQKCWTTLKPTVRLCAVRGYYRVAKKWGHRLMATILSNLQGAMGVVVSILPRKFPVIFKKIGSGLIELWSWVCGLTFWPTLYMWTSYFRTGGRTCWAAVWSRRHRRPTCWTRPARTDDRWTRDRPSPPPRSARPSTISTN